MDRLFRLIAHRPRWVLAFHALLTAGTLTVLVDFRALESRLEIETAVQKILPNKGRDTELYQRFRDRFGNDEFLFLGVVSETDTFTPENLRRVVRITERLGRVEGIRQVVSLSSAPDVRAVDGDVSVRNVFDDVPEDPEVMAALRERVLANPLHVGNLVSADGKTAAFLIYPLEMTEAEFRDSGIDQEVERIATEEAPDGEILIAGTPPLKAVTSRILRRDLFRFVPLNYAVMALVAFLVFRNVRSTIIPLVGVGLAQLWTLAVIVLADRSLNLITFIVPALVIAVGFAYSVHTVSEYDEAIRKGKRGPDAVEDALRHVSFPVFLTGLTTAAGFISLCLSTLPAIREFGAFCVVGVTGSLLSSLTFVPAMLAVLPTPEVGPGDGGNPVFDRWIDRIGTTVVGRSGFVMAIYLGVALGAAYGVSQIEVSTSFTSNLKDDHPLRHDIHAFDERVGGSITLHVVVETGRKDSMKEPEVLEKVSALQAWLDEQPEVTQTTSLPDYLKVVNQAFHDGDATAFAIPETKRLISQFLFFLWHDRLDSLVNRSFDSTDILVRIRATPSHITAGLLDRIEAHLAEAPEGLENVFVTGDTPMIVRTIDDIAWGQAMSLSGATIIIYLILVLYFRSLRIAAMALVPNALPVLVYFGVLGLSGVTLNIVSSLIACIVLGIAVDDTIHFLVRFREKAALLHDDRRAALEALRAVARPVTSTTAALSAGFLTLAVSGLRHQVEFAVLASSMLIFAWLVDVTFTPALCARMGLSRPPEAEPDPAP